MGKSSVVVARGVYLTGLGQENHLYHFKFSSGSQLANTLKVGDVCWSFYQGADYVIPVPALVRVDQIIRGTSTISQILAQEDSMGYPLLPLISVYTDFDASEYEQIIIAESRYAKELDAFVAARPTYRGYSQDRRLYLFTKTQELVRKGRTNREIAVILDISTSTVQRYRHQTLAEIQTRPERKSKVTQYRHELLKMLYTDHNIKIGEIIENLRAQGELHVSVRSVERYVARLRRENGILKSPK